MKILHILKTKPDQNTGALLDIISEGQEVTIFNLFDDQPDYEVLVELIFDHEKAVSWW
jgi:hypothetical protein